MWSLHLRTNLSQHCPLLTHSASAILQSLLFLDTPNIPGVFSLTELSTLKALSLVVAQLHHSPLSDLYWKVNNHKDLTSIILKSESSSRSWTSLTPTPSPASFHFTTFMCLFFYCLSLPTRMSDSWEQRLSVLFTAISQATRPVPGTKKAFNKYYWRK